MHFWLLAVPHCPLAEFQEARVCAGYLVPVNTLSWDRRERDSALLKLKAAQNSGLLLPRIISLIIALISRKLGIPVFPFLSR